MKTYKILTCQNCCTRVTIRGWRETQPEPTECPECGTPYTYQKPVADPDANVHIKLYYHDGEYLTGYEAHGKEAQLLEKIGLALYVDGWGYLVKDNIIEKLGTEFAYQAAVDFARPALEANQAAANTESARIAHVYAEAANTGKPIILEQYSDECNNPREECSLDNITVYALPDGKTKTVRTHTW